MFNRIDLIQKMINKLNAKIYLEIGVFNGFSFLNVKCQKKIGVDPIFKINTTKKIKSFFNNLTNINNEYYEMTSDDFFVVNKHKLILNPPKVIFIDGLHTFGQTLQDCYNSLNYLAAGGIIIMHDCSPPTAASATPALSIPEAEKLWNEENNSGWTDEWCGDTWKTIPYLIKNNPELNVTVINADYGLGVISKNNSDSNKYYEIKNDLDEYKKLSFDMLENNRKTILNLIEVNEVDELIYTHIKIKNTITS